MVWKLEPYREGAPAGFLVPLAQFPFVQLRRADPKGMISAGIYNQNDEDTHNGGRQKPLQLQGCFRYWQSLGSTLGKAPN